MIRKSVTEFRQDIGEIISEVYYAGERAVIHRRQKDCVAVVPMDDLRLLEHIENLIDIREAEKALAEGGEKPFRDILKEIEGLG